MILIITSILTIFFLANYLPVFAFGFTDWSFMCLIWGFSLLFISIKVLLQRGGRALVTGTFVNWIIVKLFGDKLKIHNVVLKDKIVPRKYQCFAWLGLILVIIAIINTSILPLILSTPIFFSHRYHNLLGKVEESEFSKNVAPLNPNQIRIVDEEMARKLADKKIGEIPALGSEITLGSLFLQKVNNKLYYIAPLEHRGFFQWINNYSKGSHGFIMVSATNPLDVKLIQELNGKPVYIKYQIKGYLFDYLPRWIYIHGYINMGIADYTFQLDENLKPFWVATLYNKMIGYKGENAVALATIDAQTGEIRKYTINQAPKWVSRIQPKEFIYNQIKQWGIYIHGFWNSLFAKTGTLKPSSNNMHIIYGNDDRVYWYTGITSSGSDDSTVGFMLIDSVTKKAKFYKVAGATEMAAAKSAEGQVQEKSYHSGYPLLYNINGIPTYVAPLKDKEGLLKLISFISVENYNVVGVGPDIKHTMSSYESKITNKEWNNIALNEKEEKKINGKISRISQIFKGQDTYIYFMIENDKRVFYSLATLSPKLPLVKIHDIVEIIFLNTKEKLIEIRSFKPNF